MFFSHFDFVLSVASQDAADLICLRPTRQPQVRLRRAPHCKKSSDDYRATAGPRLFIFNCSLARFASFPLVKDVVQRNLSDRMAVTREGVLAWLEIRSKRRSNAHRLISSASALGRFKASRVGKAPPLLRVAVLRRSAGSRKLRPNLSFLRPRTAGMPFCRQSGSDSDQPNPINIRRVAP